MSAYPPTSAAKALGTLAATLGLGLGVYGAGVMLAPQIFLPAQQQPPAHAAAVIHTKSWYQDHSAERVARLAWCNDNPGIGRKDADCQAAFAASWW
jgi:hypothetical protein